MVNASLRTRSGELPVVSVLGLTAGVLLAVLLSGLTDTAPALGRAVFYLGAVVTVGANMFPVLLGGGVGGEAAAERAVVRRIAALGNIVWVFGAVACLIAEAGSLYERRPVTPATVVAYVRAVPTGTVLAVASGAALVSCLAAVLAVRSGDAIPPGLRLVLAVLPLLPLPLSGHMRALPNGAAWLGVTSLELHVVAAVAWLGGLLVIVARLSCRHELLARALPRFSGLAGVCVFVTAFSGAGMGLLELVLAAEQAWYVALFTTGYGYILLCKGVAVTALGALGAHVRFRILPAVSDGEPTAVVRWVGWEVVVMGVAFGLAVVLSHTSVAVG